MNNIVKQKPKCKRRIWKNTIYEKTFQFFEKHSDIYKCGQHYQDENNERQVVFSISEEMEHAKNSGDKTAKSHYFASIFSPRRVEEGMRFNDQYYCKHFPYNNCLVLAYDDLDNHNGETDKTELRNEILTKIGKQYFFISTDDRLYRKVDFTGTGWLTYLEIEKNFHDALRKFAVQKGYKTQVDSVKGLTTLARCPIKNFNYDKLHELENLQYVTPAMIVQWTKELEAECNSAPEHIENNSNIETSVKLKIASTVNMCGSLSEYEIPQDLMQEAETLMKHYKNVAYKMADTVTNTTQRKISGKDVLQTLVIHALRYLHPLKNNAVPHSKCESWWKYLYENKIFTTCWTNSKWKCCRDALIDCGVLDVIDARYWFFATGENGTRKKGKCAQYVLNEKYAVQLDDNYNVIVLNIISEEKEGREEEHLRNMKIVYVPSRWRLRHVDRQKWYLYPDVDTKIDNLCCSA